MAQYTYTTENMTNSYKLTALGHIITKMFISCQMFYIRGGRTCIFIIYEKERLNSDGQQFH